MSYEPPDDEVKEALSRTHFDRYRYFLAVAAQTREIWGFGDGEAWATIDDESGKPLFCPLWPAAVYVQMWMPKRYQHVTVQALPLEDMLGDVLSALQTRKIEIVVFMTPENVGSIKTAAELIEDLNETVEFYRNKMN